MGQEPDQIRREIEATRGRMGDTVEAIGYKTDVPARTRDAVTEKKEALVGKVRNARDSVVGSIAGAKDSASSTVPDSQQVRSGARQAVGLAQRNPLGLAVGSVAVGFLAGMALPSTRVENEKVGPMADEVKSKAREVGREALDHGREAASQVAQSAAETAKETASEHGEQLKSSVADKASDVAPTSSGSSTASPSTQSGGAPTV